MPRSGAIASGACFTGCARLRGLARGDIRMALRAGASLPPADFMACDKAGAAVPDAGAFGLPPEF